MNMEIMKSRFWNGSVKAGLGAVAVSVIGWMGYAMLWDEPVQPVQLDVEKNITLLPAKAELSPHTTFRVRFKKPMVEAGIIGTEGADNPLLFDPPLNGKFIWDSTRSGNFIPAGAFPLDIKYTVTLRPGLASANDLELRRHFHTPTMRLAGRTEFSLPTERRFSETLIFNVAMDPKQARRFIVFQSDDGEIIPARVGAVEKFPPPFTGMPPLPPASLNDRADDREPENRKETRLGVTPEQLLAGGVTWHLVLRKGLPSADGKHKFAHEEKFDLGMRPPMEVTGAHAENRLNHGRTIHVKFSRAMPRDPKDPDLSDWLVVDEEFKSTDPQTGQIKPAQYKPTKVEYEISTGWRSLQIKGGFKLGQTYRVRVKPGLPSRLGLKLAGEWSNTFVFSPLPSRIYLPDTVASQAAVVIGSSGLFR
jgi:hypothetical protein